MKVRCHGCQAVWEFADSASVARCPGCHILALPPSRKGLLGAPETSEPSDYQILGLPADAKGPAIRAAWVAFLTAIAPEQFPAAVRQGRAACDRLTAAVGRPRQAIRLEIGEHCFFCDESIRLGFRVCLLCHEEHGVTSGDEMASPRPNVPSATHRVSLAIREAESRWRAGKYPELLAAVDRGLAEPDVDDASRARLELLAGHALAAQDRYDSARERWTRALLQKAEAAEARTCLGAIAYRQTLIEETIHFLGSDPGALGDGAALMLAAALFGTGRHDDSIACAGRLFGSPNHASAIRAHWLAAAAEYAGGNPGGALLHLPLVVNDLVGRGGSAVEIDQLTTEQVEALPPDLIWLSGVTLSAIGRDAVADAWLETGSRVAPSDPAFPRERGTIALRHERLDDARSHFAETERRGDDGAATRGMTIVNWLAAGTRDPEALFRSAENLQDPILLYHAGRLHERRGQVSQAAQAYSLAAQADPLMGRAFAALGILFARAGRKEHAIQSLLHARTAGERGAPVLKALATLLLERGRLSDAQPVLEELLRRTPDDSTLRHNLAGLKRVLALQHANNEEEDDALDLLDEAAADDPDPDGVVAWRPVVAELAFRAATRVMKSRPVGWIETAEELLDTALGLEPSNSRAKLRRGVLEIARAIDEGGESVPAETRLMKGASFLSAVQASEKTPFSLRFRAELHRAIALHLAGRSPQADELTTPLLKHAGLDAVGRLRARWVQALSLARTGRTVAGRVLLEESVRECEGLPEAAEFLRRVRLQILKLTAEERGPQRIEREILALEPAKRTPPMMLLYGIVLADQKRFDEASQALAVAAKEPSLRREAETTNYLMQMSRVAALLIARKEAEALRLLTRLRPTLPPDTEIDLWLNSLEVEGVPAAALRRGDGRAAVATWSSRVQRWKRPKDNEYWELVRSVAVAALACAIAAEKASDYLDAENYWRIAVTRWLEILGEGSFWEAYARRGRDLFPGLEDSVVEEVRRDLLDGTLVAMIREVIGHLRQIGDDLVAAQRFALLDQIETWRLAREPGNREARRALASCHAQRLVIFSKHQMWNEALEWGEKACETDPSDPVHFNNMAEVYGAQAQPLMAKLQAQLRASGPGPHLRPLATQIIDMLSLGLAWNPNHPALSEIYGQIAPQIGYAGIASGDHRMQRAAAMRAKLPAGELERYTKSLSGADSQQGAAPQVDTAAVLALARRMKSAGLGVEAIYNAIVTAFPQLGALEKERVIAIIDVA